MAFNKNNDFTLTNYLFQTAQREGSVDQVPFILGALKGHPKALRVFLERIMAAVHWQVKEVSDSGSYTVQSSDVIIVSGHSTTITLPTMTDGRVLVFKDSSGEAATSGQAITIVRAGSDTIDGSNTSISLGANYGAVVLIADDTNAKWHTIALV